MGHPEVPAFGIDIPKRGSIARELALSEAEGNLLFAPTPPAAPTSPDKPAQTRSKS